MEHRVSSGAYKAVTYSNGHLTCHVMTNTLEIDAVTIVLVNAAKQTSDSIFKTRGEAKLLMKCLVEMFKNDIIEED